MLIDSNNQLAILITLLYYDRPELIKKACQSIKQTQKHYQNIQVICLGFSSTDFKPLLKEQLQDLYQQHYTFQQHPTVSTLNAIAKEVTQNNSYDILISLCDDDMLYPTYCINLNNYMNKNKQTMYCYSDIILYSITKKPKHLITSGYNLYCTAINGAGLIDASQCAWRKQCFLDGMAYNWVSQLDVDYRGFNDAYQLFGPMQYTGFISQYKGIHPQQFCNTWYNNQLKF